MDCLETIETYLIAKRPLSHRITSKPPETTLATAAAVAIASGGSLSVQLNESNNLSNQSDAVHFIEVIFIRNRWIHFSYLGSNKSFIGRSRTCSSCDDL